MQRWSRLFIPTLREAPADAETISQQLLLRAGYLRQLGPGLYSFLFLGNRSMSKLVRLVRSEMDSIGQELGFPVLQPKSEAPEWWHSAGESWFRFRDRAERDLCLGISHEEAAAKIAANELRSYRQLPQVWYHMHAAFRDEARAKAGLLQAREFTAVDSYSFDLEDAARERTYDQHRAAFTRIFEACGLRLRTADARFGGSDAEAIVVYTTAGAAEVASCAACGYAARPEAATSQLPAIDDGKPATAPPVAVSTPTQKTIDEVAASIGVKPSQIIKSYLAVATHERSDGPAQTPVIVFLRGDHQVNEAKLLRALANCGMEGAGLRPMEAEEIRECFGLEPGFIGPVGLAPEAFPVGSEKKWTRPKFFFDFGLRGRRNLVAGANKAGFHLKNVSPDDGGSFEVEGSGWIDVRDVVGGEGCPRCGRPLKFEKVVEMGHLRKLGTDLSGLSGVRVVDQRGREAAPMMGAFHIVLDRVLAACIEQNHDTNGFWLPPLIAPFEVIVTSTNTADERIKSGAEEIAQALTHEGIDVLLDDRDDRPGVKFKDADLIGVPYRINVGKKLVDGQVELFLRQNSAKSEVPVNAVVEKLCGILRTQTCSQAGMRGRKFSR